MLYEYDYEVMDHDTLERALGFPVYFCISVWEFLGYPQTLIYFDPYSGEAHPL